MADDEQVAGPLPLAGQDPAGRPVTLLAGVRALPRFDLVVLVLAWCAWIPDVALGLWSMKNPVMGLIFGGFLFVAVSGLVLVGTAALVQSILGPRSLVRWLRGRVPRGYHALVLGWFVCVVAAPLVTGFEGLYLGQGFSVWRTMGPGLETIVAIDPAVTGGLNALSLLARVGCPVLLLVVRAVDVRSERLRLAAAPAPPADAVLPAGGPVPPAGQAPRELPWPTPAVLDVLPLVLVWCAPVAAVALKMTHVGWGLVLFLVVSPLLLGGAVHALWVFTAVLGGRSRVRTRLGTVPVVYRSMAAGWAVAVVLPGLAFVEFGAECLDDDCGWSPASALESMLGGPVPIEVSLVLVVVGFVVAVGLQVLADVLRRADAPMPSRRVRRAQAVTATWPLPVRDTGAD